jgi:3-aminobutyryl-CoA ammonia-lyase
MSEGLKVELRMRLSAADAHYGGNLVDGAHGLEIFGDIVTELAVRTDGDEGLFAGYEKVEFLAPMYAGDFVRATGTIVRMGNTSRTVDLELWKEITARGDVSESAADLLEPPQLVTRARGTYVVKQEFQRGPGGRASGV